MSFDDEAAFFDAWKRGVELAGEQWFSGELATATSKWDLKPDHDMITEALGWLSSGEAVFLAALYSFFNSRSAALMLARLDVGGLGGVASRVDEKRRRVLADLFLSYEGW